MKKIIIIVLFLTFIFISSCDMGSSNPTPNPTPIPLKNAVIYDDNDNNIGNAIFIDPYKLSILSSNDYIYHISWSGSLLPNDPLYFTEVDCAGTAYIYNSWIIYGKSTFYSAYLGTLFTANTINADGTLYYLPGAVTVNSMDTNGACTNGIPQPSGFNFGELKTITRAEAGIPATITPPLTIVFE
ncbi:MAG: hypothetical protein JW969_17710 [Spirochaetales bacterium]|nr:hypothetical protein [Spirochaetales bacterium]